MSVVHMKMQWKWVNNEARHVKSVPSAFVKYLPEYLSKLNLFKHPHSTLLHNAEQCFTLTCLVRPPSLNLAK